MMQCLRVVLFVIFGTLAWASQDCKNKISCSDCIQTPNCMWCGKSGNFTDADEKYLSRCIKRTDEVASRWRAACGADSINEPGNYFEMVDDFELTQAGVLAGSGSGSGIGIGGSESGEAVVQIKPQRVTMKLRVQEAYSMQVTFRQAEDYPVDLYYLMDLSKSMEDDKESLSKLGAQLAEEMQKITKNFKLGFGSFVDKVVMPYVSTVPERLQAPCTNCASPYGFRNALPLTTNAEAFAREVQDAPVSGNLDAPEGGFDAIMQAIVCQKHINWRQEARRLLVFSTDAGFHYAGDGKLGGIVKPNDGECHMDLKGEYYTHSTLQDYPSVSQINQVTKEHKMNLIFAVTEEQSSVYSRLSQMIEGSSQGELTANSSNVVELVKREYNKITSKVELKDNATAPVFIRYFSKCKGSTEKETSVCQGLRVGDQVEFRAEITVEKCPADRKDWHQVIGIYPVGLRENLTIELDMLCDCLCERPGNEGYISGAEECNLHGTYQCGVCKCDQGFLGSNCECGTNTPRGTGSLDDSSCRETNSSAICSGRGTCTCGECKCNERDEPDEVVDGKFCECTNFLCNRFNGLLCSGPDHGECVCNDCKCKPGWTGEACNCEDSIENCINPANGEICSNQGECECNQCKCFENADGRYSGKWCEDCPTCKGKCVPYKACVQCQVFETGEFTPEECIANCTLFNATRVPEAVEEEGERLCSFFDENDCRFKFVYGYDENKEPIVRVQQTLECPPKLDILGIVLGVIGAIVAVGLALLLMWKVLTTIHDKREFARFEKERMMARWDTGENPIYKQATSTFKNPMYGGK
ncbi:integrin beta-PS [Procambarus clarkii]|uniref:integrin beta-PS n=1 Tax=Procambarus clarkii TaxID=6728 RepID=UPI001E672C27|nr:integrin beta-PS-like [Procambarus clarkii]XP_045617425.1 integrin beta-PS-like [Procambarus clarkii]XP_045617426.1 integrin beta-PS-like [Procambarus clarkii]XP_045617427.1 integrin beta-PS-like [Procambarus clarkii]XP_045617428.1 integrin beta-PS-like [Procambarus clarkii]